MQGRGCRSWLCGFTEDWSQSSYCIDAVDATGEWPGTSTCGKLSEGTLSASAAIGCECGMTTGRDAGTRKGLCCFHREAGCCSSSSGGETPLLVSMLLDD